MDFEYSPRPRNCRRSCCASWTSTSTRTRQRYEDEIEANTEAGKRWTPLQMIEELKPKARAAGLWNLFLPRPQRRRGAGPRPTSSTRRCARSWAACPGRREVFNCSAPDTGNMETLERYGTAEQKEQWLRAAARRRDPLAPSR